MKTRLLIIIGIVMISVAIILFSYGYMMSILFDEHYEIEITGLKDTYAIDESYSFDYHITGYGDGCAKITVTYPDENGKTMTTITMPSCMSERSFEFIDTSSIHGSLGNVAVKTPGMYAIRVTYEPIGSFLSTTTTKQFEVIDDFEETFGSPGNRHPAFLGYDIPKICTDDMIKHLARYSSMFDRDAPYAIEDIGLEDGINVDDFDRCVDSLLEKNPKETENEN